MQGINVSVYGGSSATNKDFLLVKVIITDVYSNERISILWKYMQLKLEEISI